MKVVLLGTNGYHPNERRHTSCVMLPESGVILDAGTGIFRIRSRIMTPRLDIYLSHAHLDHVVGLTFLLGILYRGQVNEVVIHGEEVKLEAVKQHLFSEHLFPVLPRYEFRTLAAGEESLPDGGKLRHFPVVHPGGAVGYRLDWPDRSLAYVTDTTADPKADYVKHIQGVDVLLHECNFSNNQQDIATMTGHSWTNRVAEVAKAADVGVLVLTHIDPAFEGDDPIGIEDALKIFPSVILGEDNMELEF